MPPHIHPDQDEYLYMLEGKLDFMLGGAEAQASTRRPRSGSPMGMPHGIFNKSGQHREDSVLGIADPPAVRSVLGPSQHEGAETRRTSWRWPRNTTSTSCPRRRGRETRVARVERSETRDGVEVEGTAPDCAALHPGYQATVILSRRVGKGALAPCPPCRCKVKMDGHARALPTLRLAMTARDRLPHRQSQRRSPRSRPC